MQDLISAFALIALVLMLSTVLSPAVERLPISFPIIFLGLGFLLGARGLNLVSVGPRDAVVDVIATLTLALVLFLDAVNIQVDEVGRHWRMPVLILGPGTLLVVFAIAGASAWILGLALIPALIVGAALASTDPVALRDVVRDERVPRSIRQVLKLEAGLNDLVVLPIILILIAVAVAKANGAADWAVLVAQLVFVGPLIGFAIGGAGSWLMGRVDEAWGVRRELQALYGIGLVLAAFAAASAAGGDGFLAAFFAGLAVPLLNTRMCDCFLEYGEITSEMAMLVAFVLFGSVLSSLLDTVAIGATLLLAVVAIFVIRPVVLGVVLARVRASFIAHMFIGWFGPRGLNSLLLMLLVVSAGVEGAEGLLAIVGVVVLVSAVAHGASATPLVSWYARRLDAQTRAEERESTATSLFEGNPDEIPRITVDELRERLAGPEPPIVLDVRSRSSYVEDPAGISGGVRVLPDQVRDWAIGRESDRPIVAYCACRDEATSGRAARELRARGFDAFALEGGIDAWRRQGAARPPATVAADHA